MRINHNIMAMNAHNQLKMNNAKQGKSIEKLSSGLRINRAADDAAGLAISEKMRGQLRGLTQASRNAQDGISMIQTGEGALNEVSDMLTRAKELLVQKSNGTYSTADTGNIDKELAALNSEIDNIIDNTKFNGKAVLDNSQTYSIVIDDSGSRSLSINSDDLSSVKAGSLDLDNAATTVSDVESAISTVSTARANFGALQNRLEHTVNNLSTTHENLQAAEARIRDTDMAAEMMDFTKFNILQQASQSMLAQANMAPQGVLQLLG